MSLNPEKKLQVKNVVKESLRNKFRNYKPESDYMPFHYRLLGRDRMALYSFIQSLNTTFGTSIFEPAAVELAKGRFKNVASHVTPYPYISSQAHVKIQKIMDDLTIAERVPDKVREIGELKSLCKSETMDKVNLTKIDIWLQTYEDKIFMIDFKTAKPNIGGFHEFKRTLLEWVASELARNSSADVNSLIGIPYNPYEPKPYKRWTIRGMLDLENELLVAKDLWDFIGGEGAYEDFLDCFEEAGIELRPEIDDYFVKFERYFTRS